MKTILTLALTLFLAIGCGGDSASNPSGPGEVESGKPLSLAEVGNGGHGYIKNGRVYLVDLVEAGLELSNDSYFHSSNLHQINERFNSSFVLKHWELPVDAVLQTLYRISRYKDPVLALALFHTIQSFDWRVIDQTFKVLPLQGDMVEPHNGDVVLIANRRGRTIYLSRPALSKMDGLNIVATIIHEALYALIKPRAINKDESEFHQDAIRVREIVGYLMSQYTDLGNRLVPGELPFTENPHSMAISESLMDRRLSFYDKNTKARIYPDAALELGYKYQGNSIQDSQHAKELVSLTGHQDSESFLQIYQGVEDSKLSVGGNYQKRQLSVVCSMNPTALETLALYVGSRETKGDYVLSMADYMEKGEVKSYIKFEQKKANAPTLMSFLSVSKKDCERELAGKILGYYARGNRFRSLDLEDENQILDKEFLERGATR